MPRAALRGVVPNVPPAARGRGGRVRAGSGGAALRANKLVPRDSQPRAVGRHRGRDRCQRQATGKAAAMMV